MRLANALSVSTDCLLGKATSATDKLVHDFERLADKDQRIIHDIFKLMLKTQ